MPSKSQHMHSFAPKHTFHFVPARPSEPSAFQLTPRGRGLGHNVVGVLTAEVLRKPSSRLAAPKTSPGLWLCLKRNFRLLPICFSLLSFTFLYRNLGHDSTVSYCIALGESRHLLGPLSALLHSLRKKLASTICTSV